MFKSKIGDKYALFLDAFLEKNKISETEDISKLIYLDLFSIRLAQWRHKIEFKRKIYSSLSDIFQDIIAFYLKNVLPEEYEIILEEKQNKLRPDILIKKDGKNQAIIEIKTTIGWDRKLIENKNYFNRVEELSNEFKIDKKKIFYIFESYNNVNKKFKETFETKKSEDDEIFNYIFPLFKFSASPYYIVKNDKLKPKININNETKPFSLKEIEELYNQNKYIDFKEILHKIID